MGKINIKKIIPKKEHESLKKVFKELISIFLLSYLVFYLLLKPFLGSYWAVYIFSILFTAGLSVYILIKLKSKRIGMISYIVNILVIIFMFNFFLTLIYMNTPTERGYLSDSQNGMIQPLDGITASYFSGVTFTTLGFGDIQPKGTLRVVAVTQSFFGWITLSFLVLGINKAVDN